MAELENIYKFRLMEILNFFGFGLMNFGFLIKPFNENFMPVTTILGCGMMVLGYILTMRTTFFWENSAEKNRIMKDFKYPKYVYPTILVFCGLVIILCIAFKTPLLQSFNLFATTYCFTFIFTLLPHVLSLKSQVKSI